MARNRYIAGLAVAYVLKKRRLWGHMEKGIHRQFFRSFPRILCLSCYGFAKPILLEKNPSNFYYQWSLQGC